MQVDPEVVRRRMASLGDEELRRVVGADAASYDAEAVAIAREEIARRGLAAEPTAPAPVLSDEEAWRIRASSYREPRALTLVLVGLVALQMAASLGEVIAYAVERHRIAEGALQSMAGWDLVIAVSSGGRRIGYLVAVVVFCFWLHRMYKNLPPLGATAPRFTPGLAVGSYFIPLLNLVRGFQVMQALWMDSQPPPATAPVDVEPRRDPPLVYLWWGTFLAASFAGRLGGTGTATTLEEWVSASWFSTAILAGFGVSGALFIALVRGVARRQREQWDDLVRRRPVAPATDRLR